MSDKKATEEGQSEIEKQLVESCRYEFVKLVTCEEQHGENSAKCDPEREDASICSLTVYCPKEMMDLYACMQAHPEDPDGYSCKKQIDAISDCADAHTGH
jgi:hypothetical protein